MVILATPTGKYTMKILIVLLFLASCGTSTKETSAPKNGNNYIKTNSISSEMWNLNSKPSGHRLGSDTIKGYAENTLEVLNAFIDKNLHKHPNFDYFEFDVNSTSDSKLVVYHDKCFDKKPIFKCKGSNYKIKNLTFKKVMERKVSDKYKIPTPREVLDIINDRAQGSRVLVEIKLIHTDKAREKFISLIDNYRGEKLDIAYLAFEGAFKKSFPDKNKWCPKLKMVYQARKKKVARNNLCKM